MLQGRELQQIKFSNTDNLSRKRKAEQENNELFDVTCDECKNGFYGTDVKSIMFLHSRRYKVIIFYF